MFGICSHAECFSISQCRDAEDSLKAVSDGKQHKCYFLRNFIKTILNTVELWHQKGSGFALVAYVQITVIMGRHESDDKNKNFEKGNEYCIILSMHKINYQLWLIERVEPILWMWYEDHTQEPKDIWKTPIHSWQRASPNGKLHSTGFLWSHLQLHCPCQ